MIFASHVIISAYGFWLRNEESGASVWGRGCWMVYLDSNEDVLRAIRYVDNNPLKERKRKQAWKFVRPYDGPGATRDPAGHR